MMIMKEQWLIVTQNKRSVQDILMQKLELKNFKSMRAFETGQRVETGDR